MNSYNTYICNKKQDKSTKLENHFCSSLLSASNCANKLVMAASQDVRWREQSIRLQSLRDDGAEDTSSDRPTQALDHRESNRLLTELLSPPGRAIFLGMYCTSTLLICTGVPFYVERTHSSSG